MRFYKLIVVIIIVSCSSVCINTNTNTSFLLKNNSYVFSDNNIRNLKITFLNDSVIEITNRLFGKQITNYYIFYFKMKYSIKKIDWLTYKIEKPIEIRDSLDRYKYIHPFRNKSFYNRSNVFPDVSNDTIFFYEDFSLLLLKDFPFECSKRKKRVKNLFPNDYK